MAASVREIDLGFVQKTDNWKLRSHFFPSKVGGKPAWLALKSLPNIDDVSCGKCGKPCIFLLQIYAPDEAVDTCFHRSVFIFVCQDAACCTNNSNDNFVVLRSQLEYENQFYSSLPPEEKDDEVYPKAEDFGTSLCVVCGSVGPKRCARCKKASYCGKEHQTADWKAGHKKFCAEDPSKRIDHADILLPEFELLIEPEEYDDSGKSTEKTEEEKKREFEDIVKSTKASTTADPKIDADLEQMARQETEDDKIFKKFKQRIAHAPDQVLRYHRQGSPLWVSCEHKPSADDIPKCKCGAARTFEFQVMPQLLNHLNLDDVDKSIDWGTLVVFTCSANCEPEGGLYYQKEFLWKQDFSEKDLNV